MNTHMMCPAKRGAIKAMDFDDRIDILPVSDPNIFSVAQRITMAQTQLQLAQSAPQMHNMYEAYRRMYEAIGVRDIDTILNTQDIDKPKDPAGRKLSIFGWITAQSICRVSSMMRISKRTFCLRCRPWSLRCPTLPQCCSSTY
jgi:hypothetical protein